MATVKGPRTWLLLLLQRESASSSSFDRYNTNVQGSTSNSNALLAMVYSNRSACYLQVRQNFFLIQHICI
jgi:hypothetical protein